VALAALWGLAALAPFCLLQSDLPRPLAGALALAAAAWGARAARAYARQPARALVLAAGPGPASCDGRPMAGLRVAWRGPLAFLGWRGPDGRHRRLAFWPDTLPAGARRELTLALRRREAAAGTGSVAG
jgi:toxin CptA